MIMQLPETCYVKTHLADVLQDVHPDRVSLVSVERKRNIFSSSFPSEIVVCHFEDGFELTLYLKHGIPDKHTGHGYWNGTAYEAMVYQDLLQKLPIRTPRYFGQFTYNKKTHPCLVMEYIEDHRRLDKSPEDNMLRCARILGKYHGAAESYLTQHPSTYLKTYDIDYYRGWARRTCQYAGELHKDYPWLKDLCKRFENNAVILHEGPFSIIHGEFYPSNILLDSQHLYVVDWQSTVIARGEIDLASLTEGWNNTEIVRQCEQEYLQARWGNRPPANFRKVLGIARVYWPLRWLGDKPKWTFRRRNYFNRLRIEAEQADLL